MSTPSQLHVEMVLRRNRTILVCDLLRAIILTRRLSQRFALADRLPESDKRAYDDDVCALLILSVMTSVTAGYH